MRMSQPKSEVSAFSKLLGELLVQVADGYQKNPLARGTRCEYLRQVLPGIFASHSTICRRGRYYHCFAITLHKELSDPFLLSPFVAGGRFDHNYSINMAFQRDLSRNPRSLVNPFRLSDSHEMRKGAESIILKCATEAENHLLPFYMKILRKSKSTLLELITQHQELGLIEEVEGKIMGHSWVLTGEPDFGMLGVTEAVKKLKLNKQSSIYKAALYSKAKFFNRLCPSLVCIRKALENV